MTSVTRGSLTGVLAAGLLLGVAAPQSAVAGVIVTGGATLNIGVTVRAGSDFKSDNATFYSINHEETTSLVAPVASGAGATASVGGNSYFVRMADAGGGMVGAVSNVRATASAAPPSGGSADALAIVEQGLYLRTQLQFDEPTLVSVVYGVDAQYQHFAAATVNGNGALNIQKGAGRFEVYGDRLSIAVDARALAVAIEEYFQSPDGTYSLTSGSDGHDSAFSAALLAWSIGELPGLRKENPLQPNPTLAVAVWPDSPDTNQPTLTDSYVFATPVAEGYGLGADRLYFDPLLASGYRYHVDGTRFASFVVPDPLPDGDDMFELLWRGTSYALAAGQIFDFTAVDPLGAVDFDLRGLSVPHAPNATHAPFVSGITFTEAGLARVTQSALVSPIGSTVPEPTSLALAGFAGIGIAVGAWRRRRQGA